VSLSYQRDNLKEQADELRINVDRLYNWRKSSSLISPGSNKTIGDRNKEVKRLEKELRDTKLELEILKKAIHIFSKSGGQNTSL
jgi:transposase